MNVYRGVYKAVNNHGTLVLYIASELLDFLDVCLWDEHGSESVKYF